MVYLYGILSILTLITVTRSLAGHVYYDCSYLMDRIIVTLLWLSVASDFINETLKLLGN